MAIEIQPRPVRVSSSGVGKATRRGTPESDEQPVASPKRAAMNAIPAPDVLESLIGRAVSALRRGVTWDRGSILNLLL